MDLITKIYSHDDKDITIVITDRETGIKEEITCHVDDKKDYTSILRRKIKRRLGLDPDYGEYGSITWNGFIPQKEVYLWDINNDNT